MDRKTRITILSIVTLLILALPITALAAKRIYTADLLGNGSGRGSVVLGTTSTGSWGCLIQVHNLTGNPSAIRMLSSEDGSTLVNVCTGSGCPSNDSPLQCTITPPMIPPGVSNAEILRQLEAGHVFVNVETAAFPGGEVWGTLFPH